MIHLQLITPERVVLRTDVDEVTVPTTTGEITILPDHVEMISVLSPGVMRLKKAGVEEDVAVSGGMIEIQQGSIVKVLADVAERAHEIIKSADAIDEARKRAETAMQTTVTTDEKAFAMMAAALQHEMARQRVVMKHRHSAHVPMIDDSSISHEDNVN